MDAWTHGRRTTAPAYTIRSAEAFGSGEQKTYFSIERHGVSFIKFSYKKHTSWSSNSTFWLKAISNAEHAKYFLSIRGLIQGQPIAVIHANAYFVYLDFLSLTGWCLFLALSSKSIFSKKV